MPLAFPHFDVILVIVSASNGHILRFSFYIPCARFVPLFILVNAHVLAMFFKKNYFFYGL